MWEQLLSIKTGLRQPVSSGEKSKEPLLDTFISGNQENIKLQSKSHDISAIIHSAIARSKGEPIKLSPGTAQRILDEANFPGQRKISNRNLQDHMYTINSGAWDGRYPLSFAEFNDGSLWMLDGQHRLTVIVMHGVALPVTVQLFRVSNEEDARILYAGFDKKNSIRTESETLHALEIHTKLGVKQVTANALFKALAVISNNMEPFRRESFAAGISTGARMNTMHDWAAEAREFERIASLAAAPIIRKLRGAGCMAVVLYTLRHKPALAKEFWEGVAMNDGLRRNDPRAALIADFFTRTLSAGHARQSVQSPTLAWNAFCEKRDLKIIKCLPEAQIIIWGTPLGRAR
jgi:hypothetical protein